MTKRLTLATLVLLLGGVALCSAGSDVPSLLGKWATKSEGGLLLRADQPGKTTHWEPKQTVLEGELTVTEQNGRVLYGVFKSPKLEEPFVGAIGLDNRLYFADTDGYFDGTIIDANTIQIIYRHVSASDTVVAVGVWTRKE